MTPDSPATSPGTTRRRPGAVGAVVVAVVAWLAMVPVGFFYAASGLLVPGPYLFLMWAAYVVLLVAARPADPAALVLGARGAGRRRRAVVGGHQPRRALPGLDRLSAAALMSNVRVR